MKTMPFIPKKNPETPDHYGIIIHHHDGKKDEIEVASHVIVATLRVPAVNGDFMDEGGGRYRLEVSSCPYFECVSKDDLWTVIPMSSIRKIDFDKRYSKIIAMRQEAASKKKTSNLN